MKIKTNDQVKILSGKDAGKTGKVLQAFPKENKIVVEGVNQIKKHLRARGKGKNEKGQVVELSAPLAVDKVMLVCTKCGKPTRVLMKLEAGSKKRACKQCNEFID